MNDLTIVTLCQALANLTNNRCTLVENSNTCRCVDDNMGPKPTIVNSTAPDIMMSEGLLIFFVLVIWFSAIGFCLNQYKSLRSLETQSHYFGDRKDPLNIGDIKIVAREQDSIIYKKKRYSTVLDTHVDSDDLKSMQYVKEYLPKNLTTQTIISTPPSIKTLVVTREDLTANIPLSMTSATGSTISTFTSPESLPSIPYTVLSTHDELAEEQQSPSDPISSCLSFVRSEHAPKGPKTRMSFAQLTEINRKAKGLAVPRISTPSSLHSSWNSSCISETSRSAQHLSVPSTGFQANRYSESNIATPVSDTLQKTSENSDDQLLDPRRIPDNVRRSLLALHRVSQENINIQRNKEKTQSENDVHGSFTPWKMKMKSKLKRTHHHQNQSPVARPHAKTLSILPFQPNSDAHERRVSAYATMNQEYRFSTPPSRNYSLSRNPSIRRSLKHYSKYSTQSTSESETTQIDIPMNTSLYVPTNDDKSSATIDEIDGETTMTSV